MKSLVNLYDGEYWFDNPSLVLAGNPGKRRSKTMAKAKRRARRSTRRRAASRRPKHNFMSAGALANRPKRRRRRHSASRSRRHAYRAAARRHYTHNPRRHRRYRRNPEGGRTIRIFGIELPPLDAIAGVAAGVIAPAVLNTYIPGWIPTSLKNADGTLPSWLTWTIKIGVAVVPGILVRQFVNRRFGNYMLVGGLGFFAVDAIKTLAPGVIPGLGAQPLLGSYFDRPAGGKMIPYGQRRNVQPMAIADAPDRLNPAGRF